MLECNTKELAERTMRDQRWSVSEQAQPLEQALAEWEPELDLEASARRSGALVRRRGVQSAKALLRIVLGYSVLDLPLRLLGCWCVAAELAEISKTALLKRLRKCRQWLGLLVITLLSRQSVAFPSPPEGLRIRIVDATVVCQPGNQGANWRLHMGFDLGRMGIDWLQITDAHGGESLGRFAWHPGDLAVVDRGYASRQEVGHVLAAGAWVLMRMGWHRLPLEDEAGRRFDLIAWLTQAARVPSAPPQEIALWVSTPAGRFAMRLIVQAIPAAAAEKARRAMRQAARKKGRTPDERSLLAAGFVLLLTNLPLAQWPALQIVQLYRFRWQIELAFKRLKSLLNLDGLRTHDPELAQVYLLAKILAALLLERCQGRLATHYPDWFLSQSHPLSYWRLTALLWNEICQWVWGNLTSARWLAVFPKLRRFLCDEPRQRLSQQAQALFSFSGLGRC